MSSVTDPVPVLRVHWERRLTWSWLTGRLRAVAGGGQTRKYTPDITAATEETKGVRRRLRRTNGD